MTEKRQTSQGYIVRILQHFATKLRNITNCMMLFQAHVMTFLYRLVQIKISLIRGKVYSEFASLTWLQIDQSKAIQKVRQNSRLSSQCHRMNAQRHSHLKVQLIYETCQQLASGVGEVEIFNVRFGKVVTLPQGSQYAPPGAVTRIQSGRRGEREANINF